MTRVLFATAELAPLVKIGGLADVAGALPPALRRIGHDIRVIMPRYEQLDGQGTPERTGDHLTFPFAGTQETVGVLRTTLPDTDVPIILLDHPGRLSRGKVYVGEPMQELERFVFFSRAVAEYIRTAADWVPEIVHCQDWHTGLVPWLLQDMPKRPATVFTIHNLGYQGKIRPDDVRRMLGDAPEQTDAAGDCNFIQQAIRESDALTTVSVRYSREILTPAFGEGLEKDLHRQEKKLRGILNGIDTVRFDPSRDPDIAERYDVTTLPTAKPANRRALRNIVRLPDSPVPVIGMVTRLATQKGLDLVVPLLDDLEKIGAQLVILGTGDRNVERQLTAAAERHRNTVALKLTFDAKLAQQIYAGSDYFLMPSRYEPCGLGQMIAMRYGTIPIVRETGGLADTVPDIARGADGLGITFVENTPDALRAAVERATALDEPQRLAIAARGMRQDFSWAKSAREYGRLYDEVTARPRT